MAHLFLARCGFLARILVCLAGFAALAPAQAATTEKYASIIVDVDTGEVLYSRNADSYRYPASLTKMMTLYITFEALREGRMTLDDKLDVSAAAAAAAPSKLGLRAGDTLTVKEAILALVTKSANDAAVVLAEGHAGSERDFAKMMTEKARDLGMSRTTFRNASGLPDTGQRTTARDLAALGQHLITDFPEYYHYFGTASFTWKGNTFANHNRLLGHYDGTTGLKTGYTAASGFNLATSIERDGYRLVAIVMGGRTAKSRDDHMVQLLDMQFARLEGGPMIASRGPIMAALPRERPDFVTTASLDAPGSVQSVQPAQATPVPRAPAVREASFAPAGDPIGDAIAALTGDERVAAQPDAGVQLASLETGSGEGDIEVDANEARIIGWLGHDQHWGIQIGAFAAMESAAARLSAASALAPEQLAAATPAIVPAVNGGSTLYRARFGPFEEREARVACEVLAQRGINCVPVKDDTQ